MNRFVRLRFYLRLAVGFAIMLLLGSVCLSLAYFLTKWFYSAHGITMPDYAAQLINGVLSSFFS